MAIATKKPKQPDLEIIARQLATTHVLPVAEGDHIELRATAHFTTRSYPAGDYQVSVGVNQALLHLDHPSYDREQGYQATLSKEAWSQSWLNRADSQSGIGIGAKIVDTIAGIMPFSAHANAGNETRETVEQRARAPYPIVSITPTGWRIGTERGDPRDPQESLPEGLEHCLNGEYLSGRGNEQGEGCKDKNGRFVLGILRPKAGGNDPRVIATLVGVSSGLRLAVKLSNPATVLASGLGSISAAREKEQELRQAFTEICLRRAADLDREHERLDMTLAGEFFLHEHETHAPKLSAGEGGALAATLVEKDDE